MINNKTMNIKNLRWKYGDINAIENISLEIEKSKLHCIIGPNGAGKTTLLKNICRILEPNKAAIFIDGIDIKTMKSREIALKMAYAPQNTNTEFDFSAFELVLLGRNPYLRRFQNENQVDLEIVKEAMNITNTWYLKDRSINELSGGEIQRVTIARVLAQQTEIILFDEPVSHLDLHHQVDFFNTIKKLIKERNITVLVTVHDLNLAAQYGDNIIIVNDGAIEAVGSPEQVITSENIEKVYKVKVHIANNPIDGRPFIIPLKTGC